MIDKHDMVEAMLLEYISNAQPLSKVESLVSDQYTRWTEQIRDAIQYLHRNNLVWGDAKPGNILIRGTDISFWLISGAGIRRVGWIA